jgi:hypothetical protein
VPQERSFSSPLIKPDARIPASGIPSHLYRGAKAGEDVDDPHIDNPPYARDETSRKALVSCGSSWPFAKSPTFAFFSKHTRVRVVRSAGFTQVNA